jgi:hypothetical protein
MIRIQKPRHNRSGFQAVEAKKLNRDNPEGDSVIIGKSRGQLADSSSLIRRTMSGRSPSKRRAAMHVPDNTSLFDQTPASLSQISSIMPHDESLMYNYSKCPSPSKKRKQVSIIDTTMERAVQMARGEPDGADQSFAPSPKAKSKGGKKKLALVVEVSDVSSPSVTDKSDSPSKDSGKENETALIQKKVKCMKVKRHFFPSFYSLSSS